MGRIMILYQKFEIWLNLFFTFYLAFARSFQVHLQTKKLAKTKQMALQIASILFVIICS